MKHCVGFCTWYFLLKRRITKKNGKKYEKQWETRNIGAFLPGLLRILEHLAEKKGWHWQNQARSGNLCICNKNSAARDRVDRKRQYNARMTIPLLVPHKGNKKLLTPTRSSTLPYLEYLSMVCGPLSAHLSKGPNSWSCAPYWQILKLSQVVLEKDQQGSWKTMTFTIFTVLGQPIEVSCRMLWELFQTRHGTPLLLEGPIPCHFS